MPVPRRFSEQIATLHLDRVFYELYEQLRLLDEAWADLSTGPPLPLKLRILLKWDLVRYRVDEEVAWLTWSDTSVDSQSIADGRDMLNLRKQFKELLYGLLVRPGVIGAEGLSIEIDRWLDKTFRDVRPHTDKR